jgi:FkbM family methyltransferase
MKNFSSAEPDTLRWIKSFDANTVFWDVGANVGMYSLYAGLGGHTVVALEPSPWNLEALTKNILQNRLSELITVIPLAVSQQVTQTKFYISNDYQLPGGAHNSIGSATNQFGEHVQVRESLRVITLTIDALVAIFNLPKPKHMKVDIDGLELEVLKGASETLIDVQTVLVECFPSHPNKEDLFGFLEQRGFCLDSYSSYTSNSIWKNQKLVTL